MTMSARATFITNNARAAKSLERVTFLFSHSTSKVSSLFHFSLAVDLKTNSLLIRHLGFFNKRAEQKKPGYMCTRNYTSRISAQMEKCLALRFLKILGQLFLRVLLTNNERKYIFQILHEVSGNIVLFLAIYIYIYMPSPLTKLNY